MQEPADLHTPEVYPPQPHIFARIDRHLKAPDCQYAHPLCFLAIQVSPCLEEGEFNVGNSRGKSNRVDTLFLWLSLRQNSKNAPLYASENASIILSISVRIIEPETDHVIKYLKLVGDVRPLVNSIKIELVDSPDTRFEGAQKLFVSP